MNRLFLLIALFFAPVLMYGQQAKGTGDIEVAFSVRGGEGDNTWIGASATYATNLTKVFKLGGGIGYNRYTTSAVPNNIGYNTFALFAHLKAICPLSKAVSFVAVMDGGMLVNNNTRLNDDTVGAIISPQAGFRFNLSKNNGLALNARVQYQHITNMRDNILGLTLGFSF
ncbi:MAG: hypothetical protein IIX41_06990 [Bacteroidales bacterium]|nr:hypothetical protein [Bacteroidales bacterium]